MGSVTSAMSRQCVGLPPRRGPRGRIREPPSWLRHSRPSVVGVLDTRFVDDRTGRIGAVMSAIAAAATPDRPAILGGVSLGAHACRAAAGPSRSTVLTWSRASSLMPAWTGSPERGGGHDRSSGRGARGVGGRPGCWPNWIPTTGSPRCSSGPGRAGVPQHWSRNCGRPPSKPGPRDEELRAIAVPVGIVALRDDPLHPVSVARHWAEMIPRATVVELDRGEPGTGLACFGRAARAALGRWT
jgi:pimeloyl-ACP methyl ester carboxylesterase